MSIAAADTENWSVMRVSNCQKVFRLRGASTTWQHTSTLNGIVLSLLLEQACNVFDRYKM